MSTQSRSHPVIAVALAWCVGCQSSKAPDANATQSQAQNKAATQQYATGSLDQMLAPIALYPDALLAQMLMSADPVKISELDKWLKSNQNLKATELQDAAVKAGFEPSFVALVLFPQVVAKMAEQIAWTTLLGQAFAKDRSAVFAGIQKLRQQAKNVGTLKSTPQQEVETKTTSTGEQVIVIEPANPQIVYVPQYNSETVYTQAPSTTTVVVVEEEKDNDAAVAMAAGLIGFTAGIAIGASMNNNYYYGPYGWHGGAYMYNDAWDDYYDHREDAREDWMDHREDLVEERSDRLENRSEQRTDRLETTQEQRTERQGNRQENRPDSQAQRAERSTQAQSASAQSATTRTERTNRTGSTEARGYGEGTRTQAASQRSGGSDAFSGYSSGASQRSASTRGQSSRSSARSQGGGGRRR